MVFAPRSIEHQKCVDFVASTVDEAPFRAIDIPNPSGSALIVTRGFEERSVGVIESVARAQVKLAAVVINCYPGEEGPNTKFRDRFEEAASKVAPGRLVEVHNDYDGKWLSEAIDRVDAARIVVDITGVSNRGLFGALDAASRSGRAVSIAYSEALTYWPTWSDWMQLKAELSSQLSLSQLVDEKPWLFGFNHRVELIQDHEGYDSAGSDRALLGFLPFKCARLAAVLGEEDYSAFVFIAGVPRLASNVWRMDALKTINADLVKGWPVVTIPTFGYRNVVADLANELFVKQRLLEQFDVHLAILGSKLQVVACWALSVMIPSITIVTSVPGQYFDDAFSVGTGAQWLFPLGRPAN